MAGIVFVRTKMLAEIHKFYTEIIGMEIWLEQPNIMIFKSDNLLLGFHQHEIADTDSLITYFYETQAEVDEMYSLMDSKGLATSAPKENTTYQIYNFFAVDPEGRKIEFQKFLHDIPDIF